MAKGLLILAWVFFVGFMQKDGMEPSPSLVCKNYSIYRVKKIYAVLMFSLPFIFAAFKTDFVDTEGYLLEFKNIKTEISLTEYLRTRGENQLFFAIEFIFKKYLHFDAVAFYAMIALLQSVLLISTFRKYSENFRMSVYIFIASALYFSWMCNGIRQFIAVTILFAMTKYVLNNKWYVYLPVVLLLSGLTPFFRMFGWGTPPWFLCGIHQSALIVLPIYFLVQGKALNVKVWILLAVLLFLAIFGMLDSFLETSTQNTMYSEDLTYVNNTKGANPIRFLVSLVPIILFFIKRNEAITEETPRIIALAINMSFVSSTLYLASVFTSGIFVGRLPIFFELYSLILIPWIINRENESNKRWLTIGLYFLYFLYYCYQLFIAWGDITYTVEIFGIRF